MSKPFAISHHISIMPNSGAIRLMSKVMVTSPGQPHGQVTMAVWDTGAAISVIARSVAKAIGLEPFRAMRLTTAGGTVDGEVAMAEVHVCIDALHIETLMAIIDDSKMGDHKVTLGLDFISQGDFALTREEDGSPFFSFRYPPIVGVDFVQLAQRAGEDIATQEY